ncbi:MAG: protease pro-enzyme activation domain-containing protein, partial [Terriglobales bacterium]
MSYLALRRSVSVLVCSLTFATCALLLVAALSSPASAQTVTLRLPVGPAVLGPPPREVRNGTAKLTGHFNPEQMLRLVIALKPPHMAEEEQFLSELRDPRSPQFRKFLTKDEWNARYSPSEQDEKAVLDWATSQGLTITYRYPNRLMVHFEAPAATIEKAFKVTLNGYELPDGYSYFANDRAAVIPANLSNVVQWVGGLNNFYRMHPASFSGKRPPPPVYLPGPVFGKGLTVRSNGDGSKLPPSRTNGAPGPRLTNNFYDPTDLYSSQMYNYGALQNLGHCCNPSGNAGGSPPVSSIAIATFGEFAVSDIEGFLAQYPYLSSNIES